MFKRTTDATTRRLVYSGRDLEIFVLPCVTGGLSHYPCLVPGARFTFSLCPTHKDQDLGSLLVTDDQSENSQAPTRGQVLEGHGCSGKGQTQNCESARENNTRQERY